MKWYDIYPKQCVNGRRNEIHEYLKLFGYKADKTIIQVHITGFFRKKGQQTNQKETARQAATIKRYGGISFVIVGRTHDPSIMEAVIKHKKRIRETQVLVILDIMEEQRSTKTSTTRGNTS